MTEAAQSASLGLGPFPDALVQIGKPGRGAPALGVLLPNGIVLTTVRGESIVDVRGFGGGQTRARPRAVVGPDPGLSVWQLETGLLDGGAAMRFGHANPGDPVTIATADAAGRSSAPGVVGSRSDVGAITLHHGSDRRVHAGAAVYADDALVAVVSSATPDHLEAIALTDIAGELAQWVPQVRDQVWPVGPGPNVLLDPSSISEASATLLGWYGAILAANPDASPETALWGAFVMMAPRAYRQNVATLVLTHLSASAPSPAASTAAAVGAAALGLKVLSFEAGPHPGGSLLAPLAPIATVAAQIRDEIEPDEPISLRHLLAAAIELCPEPVRAATGDVEPLRASLLRTLEHDAPRAKGAAWRQRLTAPLPAPPPPAPPLVVTTPTGRFLAGIDADAVDGTTPLHDELQVRDDVVTLCDVLAARDAAPPISVGLFGQWGTGKSYFMALMRQRMKELAEAARAVAAGGGTPAYCTKIQPISFNAWHYMDANLWASLAVRLFEGMTALEEEEGAKPREEKADELLGKIKDRERALTAKDKKVRDALADPRLDKAAKRLGVEAQRGEVLEFFKELSVLKGFAFALDPRRWSPRRRAAGVLIVVLILVVAVIATQVPLAWLPAALGVALSLGRVGRGVSRTVKDVNEILVASSLKPVDVTKERIEKDEELSRLHAQLEEVRRSRDAYEYMLSRAGSEDYRRHFGLISVVRADLERLAKQLGEGNPDRRIVLYIDDLDRCPPATVVEVLQAVHLLLAFPLFVVVVGVDPRWLLRSLERHYRQVLSTGQAALGPKPEDDLLTEATPHDYLEKIFQIPFSLSPMGETGFGRLVAKLVGGPASDIYRASAPTPPQSEAAPSPDAGEPTPGAEPPPAATVSTLPPDGAAPPVHDPVAPSPPSPPPAPAAGERPPLLAPIDANSTRLDVTPDEVAALSAVGALIPTPRSAKRLVNVYRLIKAGLTPEEVATLTDGRRYEPLVVLLGALIGFPRQARVLFQALAGAGGDQLVRDAVHQPGDATDDPEPWETLRDGVAAVLDKFESRNGAVALKVRDLHPWLRIVQRYSFDGALAAAGALPATQPGPNPA